MSLRAVLRLKRMRVRRFYRNIIAPRLQASKEQAIKWVRRNKFSPPLVCIGILGFYFPRWAAQHGLHVPVGVYVAIMGLVTAAMTFHEKPSRAEKFGWLVFATSLMVAEIRNLYIADHEQAQVFSGISDSLTKTKDGLDATAKGIQDSNVRAKEQFEEMTRGFQEDMNTVTGGNSFCYFDVHPVLDPNTVWIDAIKVGKYPIRGATASILDRMRSAQAIQMAITAISKDHKPTSDEIFNAIDLPSKNSTS